MERVMLQPHLKSETGLSYRCLENTTDDQHNAPKPIFAILKYQTTNWAVLFLLVYLFCDSEHHMNPELTN